MSESPLATHTSAGNLLLAGLALWAQEQLDMVVSGYACDLLNPTVSEDATIHFELEVVDRQTVKQIFLYFKVVLPVGMLAVAGVIRGTASMDAAADIDRRTWVRSLFESGVQSE